MEVPRNPKTFWRCVVSFSLATIVMILTAHVEGRALFNPSDLPIAPIAIQDNTTSDFVPPAVFQAAGPNIASINRMAVVPATSAAIADRAR